jgi:hypothetical protein
VILGTMMVFQLFQVKRQAVRLQGHHPSIGNFEYAPHVKHKFWTAKSILPSEKTVKIQGRGPGPSESQAAVWKQFIARFDELISRATAALLTPPHPFQTCSSVTLTPNWIYMNKDGGFWIDFEFATVPPDFDIPDEFMTEGGENPLPRAILTPTLELTTVWV